MISPGTLGTGDISCRRLGELKTRNADRANGGTASLRPAYQDSHREASPVVHLSRGAATVDSVAFQGADQYDLLTASERLWTQPCGFYTGRRPDDVSSSGIRCLL